MIYYVEDDANIRELTLYALRQSGFEVRGFSDAEDFLKACANELPRLVLLDVMLPNKDGLEILRTLRENPKTEGLPVMMLSAKGAEFDKVVGLDSGADDYLAKPFGMMELVSRVNALLRRVDTAASPTQDDDLICGPIRLNVKAHAVEVEGVEVSLTLKEFDLLKVLMLNKDTVLSRSQLLEDVWDAAFAGETRTVDVHIQTLRQKLGEAKTGADALIHTVRGVGYCIKPCA